MTKLLVILHNEKHMYIYIYIKPLELLLRIEIFPKEYVEEIKKSI
jgi:hypothetical protein